MARVLEQADGNWLRTTRGYAEANVYHRWLKKGRARCTRRVEKLMIRRDQEQPRKLCYKRYEI
jgi:hypothetical protein